MKIGKKFEKNLRQRFAKKQNEMRRQPGVMGDGNGNLIPPGLDGFVYCIVGSSVATLPCNRIQPEYGRRVWVGFAPEEPTMYQVLSYLTDSSSSSAQVPLGYAPASRYELHALNGGQDPLKTHLRAITWLRVGYDIAGELEILRGTVETSTGFKYVPRQYITDYTRPVTSGKACWLLITIDDDGLVVATQGDEVDIADLPTTAPPAVPAGTRYKSCAVRLYEGQTRFYDARTNTDFWDLRFGASAGEGYTDEQAQDAVGGMIADTATIDLTYTDATPELKADVKVDSINDTHIDWGTGANQVSLDDVPDGVTRILASATLIMETGVTYPPVPLTNAEGTDWIYTS